MLNDTGSGSSEMIFRGIQWALEQGAQVISMSLGFDFPGAVKRMENAGPPTEAAVSNALEAYRSNLRFFDALMQMVKAQAAFRDTAVVVAASGNESKRTGTPAYTVAASLPAAADGVVSVGVVSVGALGRGARSGRSVAALGRGAGHVAESRVPCLVYVSKDFPRNILVKHGYNRDAEALSTEADFDTVLQRDLARLVAS